MRKIQNETTAKLADVESVKKNEKAVKNAPDNTQTKTTTKKTKSTGKTGTAKTTRSTNSTRKTNTSKTGNKTTTKKLDEAEIVVKNEEIAEHTLNNAEMAKTSKSNKRKKTLNRVLTASAIVLTAGLAVATPIVIYRKNEEFPIFVQSNADEFLAYEISLKRGSTVSNLKEKLNVFEGHKLVGIYKDANYTEEYKDTDKLTKNSKIFLKYARLHYKITLERNLGLDYVYSDTYDLDNFELEDNFVFRLDLFNESAEDLNDIKVTANGKELSRSTNGYYMVPNVNADTTIAVTGVNSVYYKVYCEDVDLVGLAAQTGRCLKKTYGYAVSEGAKIEVGTSYSGPNPYSFYSFNSININGTTLVHGDSNITVTITEDTVATVNKTYIGFMYDNGTVTRIDPKTTNFMQTMYSISEFKIDRHQEVSDLEYLEINSAIVTSFPINKFPKLKRISAGEDAYRNHCIEGGIFENIEIVRVDAYTVESLGITNSHLNNPELYTKTYYGDPGNMPSANYYIYTRIK